MDWKKCSSIFSCINHLKSPWITTNMHKTEHFSQDSNNSGKDIYSVILYSAWIAINKACVPLFPSRNKLTHLGFIYNSRSCIKMWLMSWITSCNIIHVVLFLFPESWCVTCSWDTSTHLKPSVPMCWGSWEAFWDWPVKMLIRWDIPSYSKYLLHNHGINNTKFNCSVMALTVGEQCLWHCAILGINEIITLINTKISALNLLYLFSPSAFF